MMKTVLASLVTVCLLPVAQANDISIEYSEDLSEKISEEYGDRERKFFETRITKALTDDLGDDLSKFSAINVIVNDAKPNRPTFKQLGDTPGLSFQSVSLGGADLSADLIDKSGNVIETIEYDFYTQSIRDSVGRTTWADARRAIRRFSDRVADKAKSL